MPSTKIFNSINKPRSKFFYNESFHPEYLNTLYIDSLIKRKFHERKLEINKPRSKFLLSINSSKSCRLNIYIYTLITTSITNVSCPLKLRVLYYVETRRTSVNISTEQSCVRPRRRWNFEKPLISGIFSSLSLFFSLSIRLSLCPLAETTHGWRALTRPAAIIKL